MIRSLEHVLASCGLSLDALTRRAEAVVLFGSRAAGCARADSDWDLLVLGRAEWGALRDARLHLVHIPEASSTFWGSDLACHASRFGHWLSGTPFLTSQTRPELALERKLRLASREAGFVADAWTSLAPARRPRHLHRVRRDLQRAAYLARTGTVPPTAWLDEEWRRLSLGERESLWTIQLSGREGERILNLPMSELCADPECSTSTRATSARFLPVLKAQARS